MSYVDGFIVPVPIARFEEYRALAEKGAAIWKELGAISVLEARADDAPVGELTSFPRSVMAKEDETVVFSYITYRDRAHRDEVTAAAMKHEGFMALMNNPPFDGKRIIWGGFAPFVTA